VLPTALDEAECIGSAELTDEPGGERRQNPLKDVPNPFPRHAIEDTGTGHSRQHGRLRRARTIDLRRAAVQNGS